MKQDPRILIQTKPNRCKGVVCRLKKKRRQCKHQRGPDEAQGSVGEVVVTPDPHREFATGAVIPNSIIIYPDRVLARTKPREYVCAWIYLAASVDVCI